MFQNLSENNEKLHLCSIKWRDLVQCLRNLHEICWVCEDFDTKCFKTLWIFFLRALSWYNDTMPSFRNFGDSFHILNFFFKYAQIQIWNILVIPSIFLEFLGTIMFIWFFLCLCNFYRFFCNLIEVPTVQNCCTFWILLIFPEGINKLYYSSKFNKTLSWSNWSAAPLISLPKLKVAGSSLCGAHIFCTSKRVGCPWVLHASYNSRTVD